MEKMYDENSYKENTHHSILDANQIVKQEKQSFDAYDYNSHQQEEEDILNRTQSKETPRFVPKCTVKHCDRLVKLFKQIVHDRVAQGMETITPQFLKNLKIETY